MAIWWKKENVIVWKNEISETLKPRNVSFLLIVAGWGLKGFGG